MPVTRSSAECAGSVRVWLRWPAGFGCSLVGAHFIFAISQLQRRQPQGGLSANWLADEAFLVRNLTPTAAGALLGLGGGFCSELAGSTGLRAAPTTLATA